MFEWRDYTKGPTFSLFPGPVLLLCAAYLPSVIYEPSGLYSNEKNQWVNEMIKVFIQLTWSIQSLGITLFFDICLLRVSCASCGQVTSISIKHFSYSQCYSTTSTGLKIVTPLDKRLDFFTFIFSQLKLQNTTDF